MTISSVCVYCGSSSGRQPAYLQAARTLGRVLVRRNLHVVYGGAKVGLMGALADAALEAGGRVTGVIPRALAGKEVAHDGLSELIVTESMHERKMIMAERSDACIALPGGIGTLEELFEAWTWTQLGFQKKPCGLLDTAGYFDALVQFLDRGVEERFLSQTHRDILLVDTDAERLLDRLEGYQAPSLPKWIPPEGT
jgi:uncharacterized protein (TIGR00730 family)